MANFKEKTKEFWNKNGKKIAVTGAVVGAGTIAGLWTGMVYKAGFMDGGCTGFGLTIDWFEKHFPEANVKALWEQYQKENPDKIVKW